MGKTFRYYTLLHPLRDSPYIDDGTAVLAKVPVLSNGRTIEVALIGALNDPKMIRVSVSGVEQNPSDAERKCLDDLAEAMLVHLRIFHDNEIVFTEPRFKYANLIDDNQPPNLNTGIVKSKPTYNVDASLLHSFMHSDKELQDILQLYAAALFPYVPVQYRYLSAFKIIEHDFKLNRSKWKPDLEVLLDHFKVEYDSLGVSKMKMKAFMINLRDKCAHIKLGNADDLAIVGIGSKDTELVVRFLPLFMQVVAKHVFDTYKSDGDVFRRVPTTEN
jgi:hypothetical protein